MRRRLRSLSISRSEHGEVSIVLDQTKKRLYFLSFLFTIDCSKLTGLHHRVPRAANGSRNSHYCATHASLPILTHDVSTRPALYLVRKSPRIQGRQLRDKRSLVRSVSRSCQSAEAAIHEKMGSKRYHSRCYNGPMSGKHGCWWVDLHSWEAREGG